MGQLPLAFFVVVAHAERLAQLADHGVAQFARSASYWFCMSLRFD